MADPFADTPDITDALRLGGDNFDQVEPEDKGPLYRVFADSKIPVSKAMGKLWSSRVDQAKAARQDIESCWGEAIAYYENDQMSHRNGTNGTRGGNNRYSRNIGDSWSETENVVFSNIVTLLPMLYAKNPKCEFTARNPEVNAQLATCVEAAVNAVINMKDAPGIGLKNKVRRCVLNAMLTNASYLKIGWTAKDDSSEEAIIELQELSKKLEAAKDRKTIIELEGQITALEEKISFLSPSGPWACAKSPYRIFYDPSSLEPDFSDAGWVAEWDFLPTSYINAVYASKHGEEFRSVYEPTHVLNAGGSETSIEDEVNNFSLINGSSAATEASKYGYSNVTAFKSAQHTKVWWIWDKTTRRVMLFADNKWEWPLWVWDDPLKLLRFFPYFRLWFHETVEGSQPKGEVTYMLDQQDAINDIHSEVNRMRKWAKSNLFYNKNAISQSDAEQVLKGPDGTARGLDVPEGMKINDVIQAYLPPSINRPELWDVSNRFAAINRITGINDAQRGAQFKTNTTNDAIDAYQKNVDIRLDEKIDAIEDWIGDFAWALAQLLLRYWTQEDVAKLVGPTLAQSWKQITDPNEFRTTFNFQVVGGSTDKPTSKAKKREALEIAQACGQFANAIPALGIVAVKALSQAFDNVVITEVEWQEIRDSMQAQTQKAGAGPNGEPQQPGAQGQEVDPAQQEQQAKEQLAQVIKQLTPEQKQELEQLIASGISPTDALNQVMQSNQTQAQ